MHDAGYFILVIGKILHMAVSFYQLIVIASVIISWVRPNPANDIIRNLLIVIRKLTEPVFSEVRKRLPRSFFTTGLDFTPIIVWFGLMLIDWLVIGYLMDFGYRMRMGVGLSLTPNP